MLGHCTSSLKELFVCVLAPMEVRQWMEPTLLSFSSYAVQNLTLNKTELPTRVREDIIEFEKRRGKKINKMVKGLENHPFEERFTRSGHVHFRKKLGKGKRLNRHLQNYE